MDRGLRMWPEMRKVLAELELLSHGATMQWNSSGGKSCEHPGGKRPGGDSRPLHDVYRELWGRAGTDEQRRNVVDDAQQALRAELVQQERKEGETPEQKRKRCIETCAGRTAGEAAEEMRETTTWVLKARIAAERDPSTGNEVVVDQDWRITAQELAERNVSLRVIGQRVGKSHIAVRNALRKAA